MCFDLGNAARGQEKRGQAANAYVAGVEQVASIIFDTDWYCIYRKLMIQSSTVMIAKATASIKPRRGRPVNERRREEIIAVATRLFMRDGLHATTMDSIAHELGISKLTLYSRFENKDALFFAVIEAKAHHYIPSRFFEEFHDHTFQDSLYRIGYGLLRLVTSDDAVNIERMLMAAAKQKKNLTKLFYEAGPARMRRLVAQYLEGLHREGVLHVPDPLQSTYLFLSLFKGSEYCLRIKMNIPPKPSKREMEDYCREAVRMFITAHAVVE